jgi:serine/threonine protein kinase
MIGLRINNYEVKALIGEGGMGSVYLAEHPMIGRQVAVKVLKPGFATAPDVVARFFNEAKAANAIGHAGIVDVVDVGTLPDGLPYLIMELLRGESLAARIEREGRLSLELATEVGRQAASALGAAHAVGIVHRDLKPANLFLAVDREQPSGFRLKVLDFGIAKLSGSLRGDQVKTGTGAVLGTPAYMSPEQSLGRQDGIDHRTDVYALGLILHHALAGSPPFMAEGFGEMVMLHMTAPPPPLRTKNLAVSAAMEALVLRALAKRPEDRFQSMAEMGLALGVPMAGSLPATLPLGPSLQDAGQAATVRIEPTPPKTVRLSPESAPPGSGGPLSTTLSSSAVQVRPPTPAGRGRRVPVGLTAGGLVVAGGLVLVAVMMVQPGHGGRGPSSGAAQPDSHVIVESAPRNPRPTPSPAAIPAQPEGQPKEEPQAPIVPVPVEGSAPPAEAQSVPIQKKVVKSRPRAAPGAPASATAHGGRVTSNLMPAADRPKESSLPASPGGAPMATPDAAAPKRMKRW